jgi:hypothetical protein
MFKDLALVLLRHCTVHPALQRTGRRSGEDSEGKEPHVSGILTGQKPGAASEQSAICLTVIPAPSGVFISNLIQPPAPYPLSVPNIPLSALLSNTSSTRSSFNANDQVSHPHKTTKQKFNSRYFNLYIV